MVVPKEFVMEAVYEAGLDDENVYEKYSGRAMYGSECFGITGGPGDALAVIAQMGIAIGRAYELDEKPPMSGYDLERMCRATSTDSMGMSMITYWPGFELGEEE